MKKLFREEGPDSPKDRELSKPVCKKKPKTFQKMDSLFSFELLHTEGVAESHSYYLIPVRNGP